jgi:processive 1,2-diacylglycerol beta-glucosyltransferase
VSEHQVLDPRDLMVISATAGAGHNAAASAILAGLGKAVGDPPEMVDAVDKATALFRKAYVGSFKVVMAKLPWLWGAGFWLSNQRTSGRRGPFERSRQAWEALHLRRLKNALFEQMPRLIVHTHFLAPSLVAEVIEKNQLAIGQFVVVTDTFAHRWWYAPNVDRYFVASEEAVDTVRGWGVSPDRIVLSGIPVHPKWLMRLDRNALLDSWDLPRDRRIVVLAGGAQFTTGPIERIAQDIIASCDDVFVVVLTGSNRKLQLALTKLARSGLPVRGVMMTDRVHELVELASLMVTKPGGISTSECAAKGKPMVFLNPVPGQEAGNAEHYSRHGAGITTDHWKDVAPIAGALLNAPGHLARMASNAAATYRPATEIITREILQRLSPPFLASLAPETDNDHTDT